MHRYQGGDGFSEMLLFEGLETLRKRLFHPSHQLYFAEGFSKPTRLTTLEMHRHLSGNGKRDYDDYPYPWHTFSASSCPIHWPF